MAKTYMRGIFRVYFITGTTEIHNIIIKGTQWYCDTSVTYIAYWIRTWHSAITSVCIQDEVRIFFFFFFAFRVRLSTTARIVR